MQAYKKRNLKLTRSF